MKNLRATGRWLEDVKAQSSMEGILGRIGHLEVCGRYDEVLNIAMEKFPIWMIFLLKLSLIKDFPCLC